MRFFSRGRENSALCFVADGGRNTDGADDDGRDTMTTGLLDSLDEGADLLSLLL